MSIGKEAEHGMREEERDKGFVVICQKRTTLNAHATAAQSQIEEEL